jgi:ParB family transcriptional regulator, chromosome partitioning protein
MSKVKKNDLGKGIAALLGNIEEEINQGPEAMKEVVRELSHSVALIPIDQIEINPYQPRKHFNEEALNELRDSIKIFGIIQPLTVRRMTHNQYQLISGERRLRASKLAELTEVPAYVRLVDDQELMEMALIENIQREDLNPIEIATTYSRLKVEFGLTDEKLGERVERKRSTVTNMLSLLKLPDAIQQSLKEGKISVGHAKVLGGVGDDRAFQLALHLLAVEKKYSVRDLEAEVSNFREAAAKRKKAKATPSVSDEYKPVVSQLSAFFGTKVGFKVKANGGGSISINFKSNTDLSRILDLIEEK